MDLYRGFIKLRGTVDVEHSLFSNVPLIEWFTWRPSEIECSSYVRRYFFGKLIVL